MKPCKDCKHINGSNCYRPNPKLRIHPVSGLTYYPAAHAERQLGPFWAAVFGGCGSKGRFFEPKPEAAPPNTHIGRRRFA